jgi:Ca2+-binding RTX toxin-like protein
MSGLKNHVVVTEALEERRLYSSGLSYDGNLSIGAADSNDVVLVRVAVGLVRVDETQNGVVRPAKFYDEKRVHMITWSGGDGADSFTNNTQFPSYCYGGNGNDTITSGNSRDRVYGEAGNDFIQLLASDDWCDGGLGNDIIVGFNGNDVIYGNFGNDSIWGQAGNDWLAAGAGDDVVVGGDGADSMYGEAGRDSMWGEGGQDNLNGGDGNDYLNGGQDRINDNYYGGGGNDVFVTDWVYTSSGWQNREYAGDYDSWTANRDYWTNP